MKTWKSTACLLMAWTTASIQAGRPLTIDDAEPVELRQFELEMGVGYVSGHNITHFDFPLGLAYGLLPRLEAGIGIGGQFEERSVTIGQQKAATDLSDMSAGVKYKVFNADRFWADQAIALTIKLPTANYHKGFGTGRADYDFTWITSKSLSKKCMVHANVGYTWTGNRSNEVFDDLIHYGVASDYQLTEKLQFVLELFANTPTVNGSDTSLSISGGARYALSDNLIFDTAIGSGLRRDQADIRATIGLTWTFGFKNQKK